MMPEVKSCAFCVLAIFSPYKTFSPMNSADTESSANIDVNAFAIIEETERTVTFPISLMFPF